MTAGQLAKPHHARRKGADTFSDFLQDRRPKVRLPGDNRLLSDVAIELGTHLSNVLYQHTGEVVEHRDDSLHAVSAQQFRTLVEQHVTCYRVRSFSESNVQVDASLNESDARGILASPQLRELLRPLKNVNTVRLPVFRADQSLELLPQGYDVETATLTHVSDSYAEDLRLAEALTVIHDLFGEFKFTDGKRSLAVAVSALVGLYAKQLIPVGELRPAFTFLKNAEGAGATTLAACAIVPVMGHLPVGSKAKDDDEMRKVLTSTIRTGQDVIFLDNVKGHLNSPSLEAFVSTPTWSDRLLGANVLVTGRNTASVFITSNGLTFTPDWRRRSLFAELHLSEERAEDKVFERELSVTVLKAMRPRILAACWSLVRHWHASGRPKPSRSHTAFPAWASIIGGIVESAGFSCPFTTSNVAMVADEDGQNMRLLTAEMVPGTDYTAVQIADLCRRLHIFESLVGAADENMGRSEKSAFGKLLARYADRQVQNVWFTITGDGHSKRFRVLQSGEHARSHGLHGTTPPI